MKLVNHQTKQVIAHQIALIRVARQILVQTPIQLIHLQRMIPKMELNLKSSIKILMPQLPFKL